MSECKIVNRKGYPELYIDGSPVVPIVYALSDFPGAKSNTVYAQRNIRNFGDAGINIVALDTDLRLGWRKGIPFDPEPLIAEISDAMEANPNAKFIIRLHVNAPYWWCKDNIDECVVYRTPEGDHLGVDRGEDYVRLIRGDRDEIRASAASEKFLTEASDNIKVFLEAIKGTPEGDALLGIQPAYGRNGEWHSFGPDVSRPKKEYFKRWLKEKYKTERALRDSWNNPTVDFDTAEFHPEHFSPGDDISMRDPRFSQNITDSQIAYQEANVDALLLFCRAIKSIMPNILCGSFYSYIVCVSEGKMPIGGHLAIDKIYRNRDVIDFLAGPACYAGNRKSDGVPMQRALLESHRLNGLLWLTEMDQPPVDTDIMVGGSLEKMNETLSVLYRNAFMPLLSGEGFWFYDHRLLIGKTARRPEELPEGVKINPFASNIYRKKGWWDNPHIMKKIADMRAFAETVRERNYSVNSDVLIVIDPDSYYHRAAAVDGDGYYTILESFGRAGVATNLIYSRDLKKCDISKYKCVVFTSSFALTPEERELYNEVTKNTLTVYLNCHGYCDKSTLSEENISAAVGMKMTRRIETAMFYDDGTKEDISANVQPVFSPKADSVEVLTKYEDGTPAAVRCGNRIYIPGVAISERMANYLIDTSGAHRYTTSREPVVAGFGYVMLNCQHAGTRTLTFPSGKTTEVKTCDFETVVYDINSGERVI